MNIFKWKFNSENVFLISESTTSIITNFNCVDGFSVNCNQIEYKVLSNDFGMLWIE